MSKKKKQRVEDWVSKITPIVEKYRELDAFCDDAIDKGFLTSDNRLYGLIWEMFDTFLNSFDEYDLISWYIFDNRCGEEEKDLSIVMGGETRKIKTIKQLAKVIVENEDE